MEYKRPICDLPQCHKKACLAEISVFGFVHCGGIFSFGTIQTSFTGKGRFSKGQWFLDGLGF